MKSEFILTPNEVVTNVESVRAFMKKEGINAFYFSSFDTFLNEYTPLNECHRYYFSGFTGSTAELLVTLSKVYLFVDGRYYEQADLEVSKKLVTVMKEGNNLLEGVVRVLQEEKIVNLGVEGDRTSVRYEKEFAKISKLTFYDQEEIHSIVKFVKESKALPPIYPVSKKERGDDFFKKATSIVKSEGESIFLAALDSIAWISNARGFHLPFQSPFLAKALLLKSDLYLFIDESISYSTEKFDEGVHFVPFGKGELLTKITEVKRRHALLKVSYDTSSLTGADERLLQNIFKEGATPLLANPLIPFQSIKTKEELKEISRSFDKANKVIADSANWLKKEVLKNKKISELDFYHQVNSFYKKSKAVDQSFNTIAAVGDHSSIIHFGSPEERRVITKGDLVLLDSGALYKSGFATDTTRTFLVGKTPKKKIYKEIYTLVLKGLINAESAAIPMGAVGSYVDSLARDPIVKASYNYAHGTGHGVGINVHEGGIRFSFMSDTKLQVGQVVSVEPGIYLPGIGGVRLENVVTVIPHPTRKGMLGLKPLTYVGFDENLIDKKMLTKAELSYLALYEKECKRRKTTLTSH